MLSDGGPLRAPAQSPGFAHEAFVYDDDQGFLAGTGDFVRAGTAAGDAVVVAVPAVQAAILRDHLAAEADRIEWLEVEAAGLNPGRMIPLWLELLGPHAAAGRSLRAVAELGPTRCPAEDEEAVLNEALLNLAFDGITGFRLRCQYDARSVAPEVVNALARTHRVMLNGVERTSALFDPLGVASALFAAALPPGPAGSERWPVAITELRGLRSRIHAAALRHGLSADQADDVVLATHEICKNSVRFAGGGTLTAWVEGDTLICEVTDHGRITELLVGRSTPAPTAERGRGLWLANQLCDLVQIRSSDAGTVVRLHAVR